MKKMIFLMSVLLVFSFYGEVSAKNIEHNQTKITLKKLAKKENSIHAIIVNPNKVKISINSVTVPEEYVPYFYFTTMSSERESLSKEWLNKAMSKYPSFILNDNINTIYVSRQLYFYETRYGGTNIGKDIYLTNQDYYTFTDFEKIFHAEFSSILYNNNQKKFNSKAWQALNPKGFEYGTDGGYEYLQSLTDFKYNSSKDKVYIETGFLTEYATTSLENDFNAIVRAMFSGDKTLWENIDNNPSLNGKLDLAIKFYNSLDPMFTKEYFKNL